MDPEKPPRTPKSDPKVIAAVLNGYAHGATTEQSARSAGVDVATAYKIIADAIAAQQSRESHDSQE